MGLWSKVRGQKLDEDDLQQEIEAHLAIAADDRVSHGAGRRSAELASLKDFGNVAHIRTAVREVWRPRWIEFMFDVGRDARFALRLLVKNPMFALTVISVLTVGIALNATVFTLLKSLALSPLSGVNQSINLNVVLYEAVGGRQDGLSYPDFKFVRDESRSFNGLAASSLVTGNLGTGSRAEQVAAELVSGNYFEVLGVRAQLGRVLSAQDEIAPGQHPVAVLSDALWRHRFNADPNVIGQTIKVNAFPLTVVGVADRSFHGTIVSFDIGVFAPLMMSPQIDRNTPGNPAERLSNKDTHFLMVLGWLRPGLTRDDAAAEAALLSARLDDDDRADAVAQGLKVLPIWRSPYGAQTYLLPAVSVLLAMGALLMLIACANVAGLVLAHGVSRRGEIALRLALGASRRRIVRLLLVENILLAIPATALAALVLPRLIPAMLSRMTAVAPVPIFLNLSFDRLVLAFSIVTAIVSAVAFGLIPALQNSRVALQQTINEDLSPRGASRSRFRGALVVSQVTVSMLLLVAANLVNRSLEAARHADNGFNTDNVVAGRLNLMVSGYDNIRGLAFYDQLLERLRSDAGTEAAAITTTAPLTLVDDGERHVSIEGYAATKDEDLTFLSNVVSPQYFRTLRIGVIAGREFQRADDEDAPSAAIVNETFARRFWKTPQEAIGKRLKASTDEWRTVVGVVRDAKYSRITEAPRPYLYLPLFQAYEPGVIVYLRSAAPTAAAVERLRTHIAALDPELPTARLRPLLEMAQSSLAFLELAGTMLFVFGIAGMALAAMGLYGLVSYTVRQSTHEIGIRMALGAHGRSLVWAYLRRGLRLGAIGTVAGIVAALASTRLLSSVLYGISATDVGAFASAFALILTLVGVATLMPAWRASRISVVNALRHQ